MFSWNNKSDTILRSDSPTKTITEKEKYLSAISRNFFDHIFIIKSNRTIKRHPSSSRIYRIQSVQHFVCYSILGFLQRINGYKVRSIAHDPQQKQGSPSLIKINNEVNSTNMYWRKSQYEAKKEKHMPFYTNRDSQVFYTNLLV
ncbi:PREDICTED: uncharacterized protein LOC109128343 [Camelina sativa]|uniref:Uncharacterized protein LOC109128343 n=1 Tax=Camelina sativa TaxID=90675 RepID=A0ABM1QTJ0_CAMSA|nr:PREDICTED: uncharacterized protein LOC109128343 [Camelina sativa]